MHRILNYLNILTRPDNELVERVLNKQMETRTAGEWFDTMLHDFQAIGEEFNPDEIVARSKAQHKEWVRKKTEQLDFKELLETQKTHTKERISWTTNNTKMMMLLMIMMRKI